MNIISECCAWPMLGFLVKMNTFNILNEHKQLGVNALRIQITWTMNQCCVFSFDLFNYFRKNSQCQMASVSVSVKLKQSSDNDNNKNKAAVNVIGSEADTRLCDE